VAALTSHVETQSGDVSRVITGEQVNSIELNGRNYAQLLQLLPGAVIQTTDAFSLGLSTTGQAIIRAIVAGERDPLTLAQLRNPACKSSEEMIAKALTGTWKDELLFVLQQALVIYDVYTAQIAVCDSELEQYLQQMQADSFSIGEKAIRLRFSIRMTRKKI